VPALALHSFSRAIEIPSDLRDEPLDAWPTSARLNAVLERFGIQVLGDLHGRKVVDFAWEKNCGPKTLYELDLLARRARFRNGKASSNGHRNGCDHASHMPLRSFNAGVGEVATTKPQDDGATFAIPQSVCSLLFDELPISRRLTNVVRSIGARSLGDLNGRNAFELLQYKACGWTTFSEIQQLIERATSGEFDVGQIEQTTAAAELLRLLEEGIAKLPLRDKEFVLAKIGGELKSSRGPRAAELLCLSYAEIGRRYGLTRARVHKVFVNALDSLRRIWGPRVPRLLEVIKWRCLSTVCPLIPQLLEEWVDLPAGSSPRLPTPDCLSGFGLSMEAHVRLIAALDKNIPCWPEPNRKLPRTDDFLGQFDVALAQVVYEAGGQITLAEAYRQLSYAGGGNYRRLTIQSFLGMLRGVQCTVIEFNDLELPIVRLRSLDAGIFPGVPLKTGKTPASPKIRSDSSAIQLFKLKTAFCERRATARR
jgi:hypothetical protein